MLWSGRRSVAALVPHNKKVPRSNPPVYTFSLWVPKAVTVTGAMSVNVSMYGCLSMETCPGCALSLALNGKWDRLRPPLYHSCTLKIQFVSSHFYTSVDFTQLNFVYVITVGRYHLSEIVSLLLQSNCLSEEKCDFFRTHSEFSWHNVSL